MKKTGLLFYVSGDSTTADYAAGDAAPTFDKDIAVIGDGAKGNALECADTQALAWKAPGNIYAARGTLSFFWRSRYPLGPTAIPIFRVAFADSSTWDHVWLRIDWNGEGYEAFITDINLSRARVVHYAETPDPKRWTHFALGWDERWGIRFYINGKKAAEEYRPAVYSAGLDQFGPHSRIISSWNVVSAYNFIRGGDIDEIAIYDHMLLDDEIDSLAHGNIVDAAPFHTDMQDEGTRASWLLRQGFTENIPAIPDSAAIRKVEVHEAWDLKRWWWKGCDGIRETTWPGVYNRSRLKGRNDYFQLPDWDCYSISGKAITFHTPDEPFNHIEISGSAYGAVETVDEAGNATRALFVRKQGLERSVHRIDRYQKARVRLTNELAEEPIGDFSLFYVVEGHAPAGVKRVQYRINDGYNAEDETQMELVRFIKGRYPAYERNIMTAVSNNNQAADLQNKDTAGGCPIANLVIPYDFDDSIGLDGIELTLPILPCATDITIQIKDPLWYYRNLAHFTFHAEEGSKKTIWFDTRDRLLPNNKCLYLTIAFSNIHTVTSLLENTGLCLIYKSASEAREEHIIDRFTQARDNYANLVEEQPGLPQHNMFNRFAADIKDLLRVDPKHQPGQFYYYDKFALQGRYGLLDPDYKPDFTLPEPPDNIPAWAYWQTEFLKRYKYVANWLIDNRQIENGEFGGGLSDDGDLVCTWVILVNMGCDPQKIRSAMERNLDAFYKQGLFTNGLPSIQCDELHTSEEGLISLNGSLSADYGNPKMLERAMETARNLDWLTGINSAGHRHIRSCYFNGTIIATEYPWNVQKPVGFAALSPIWQLSRYNRNPIVRRFLIELSDGLLAHYHPEDGTIHQFIRFDDDCELQGEIHPGQGNNLFKAAWYQTGNREYVDKSGILPELPDMSDQTAWKTQIAAQYKQSVFIAAIREYYNTHGHPWIDRIYLKADRLLSDRLADPYATETRSMYPSNRIAWRFKNAGDDENLAILSPVAEDDHVKLIIYNLLQHAIEAKIVGNEILPGSWEIIAGRDYDENDAAETGVTRRTCYFERSLSIPALIPPGQSVLELRLIKQGRPYWDRCDLGICQDDIRFFDHGLNITVHSLGALASPAADIALKNSDGKVIKLVSIPPMEAPDNLWPRHREATFNLHNITSLDGCYIEIDPEQKLTEITRRNNIVYLRERELYGKL